jgi:hypothetical protein
MKNVITALSILVFNIASFGQWSTSGSNIYNTNTGNVGIGNTSPTSKLDIVGPGSSNSNLLITRNNWSNAFVAFSSGDQSFLHSVFAGQRSRGTWQSPSSVLSGDRLGSFGANGYSGTSYSTGAAMEMYAGPSIGTYIIFGTTATPGATRTERVRITESGNVGIGLTSPTDRLAVGGNVRANQFLTFSDSRFKTNIKKIENPLESIKKLYGVTYSFKKKPVGEHQFSDGVKIGLIAQEVQKVFPELVSADGSGFLAVDYSGLIPVLLESIKELDRKLNTLKELYLAKEANDSEILREKKADSFLDQNSPNPTSLSTTILYKTDVNSQNSFIILYDFNGQEVKKFKVDSGEGSLEIKTSEMKPGIYFYSLFENGKGISTKRLLVSK